MPGQSNAMIQKCPRCASPVPPAATLDDACSNCGRFYRKTLAAQENGTLNPAAPDEIKIARLRRAQERKDQRRAQIEAAREKAKKELDPGKVITWALVVFFFVFVSLNTKRTQESSKPIFSSWDGSHFESEWEIKKVLKDPKSYEHVSTTHTMLNGRLLVSTHYRARNSFGALVPNYAVTSCDEDGRNCVIVETGN